MVDSRTAGPGNRHKLSRSTEFAGCHLRDTKVNFNFRPGILTTAGSVPDFLTNTLPLFIINFFAILIDLIKEEDFNICSFLNLTFSKILL